jgi:hypothetical protein
MFEQNVAETGDTWLDGWWLIISQDVSNATDGVQQLRFSGKVNLVA